MDNTQRHLNLVLQNTKNMLEQRQEELRSKRDEDKTITPECKYTPSMLFLMVQCIGSMSIPNGVYFSDNLHIELMCDTDKIKTYRVFLDNINASFDVTRRMYPDLLGSYYNRYYFVDRSIALDNITDLRIIGIKEAMEYIEKYNEGNII